MSRVIAALTALVVGWLGFLQPIAAAATPPGAVATYAYNSPDASAERVNADCERGPPTAHDHTITVCNVVDRWSDGASGCRVGTKAPATITYPDPVHNAGVARVTTTTREQVRRADGGLLSPAPAQVAANTASGAESALSGALLRTHLRQLEKYGQGGFRELESGRFRYYGNLSPAAKEGEMAGRRLVREWDPATGYTRTWHETIDQAGNTRIVRPETGGPKTHYSFDEFGNYGGAW